MVMADTRSALLTAASDLYGDLGHAVLWPVRRPLVIEPHLVCDDKHPSDEVLAVSAEWRAVDLLAPRPGRSSATPAAKTPSTTKTATDASLQITARAGFSAGMVMSSPCFLRRAISAACARSSVSISFAAVAPQTLSTSASNPCKNPPGRSKAFARAERDKEIR